MRIGVDLGGTKIEALALSDDGGELLRQRVATPSQDYAAIVRAIAQLVGDLERQLGARAAVGIGTPGAPSPVSGLMRNSNTTCLNGKPLLDDLSRALGREVRLANDANCFALSEAIDGAATGAEVVFGVILGTGVGGGIVVGGRPVLGHNGIAGEWGHNPVPWPSADEVPGAECYCGKRGCIETFLSGPGLSGQGKQLFQIALDARSIATAADTGDSNCQQLMTRYEDRLARSLAQVINVLDPDVIVLGGGLSNIARLYSNVPLIWERYVFSDSVRTALLPARHGDSGGVRGAAWLWPSSAARSS